MMCCKTWHWTHYCIFQIPYVPTEAYLRQHRPGRFLSKNYSQSKSWHVCTAGIGLSPDSKIFWKALLSPYGLWEQKFSRVDLNVQDWIPEVSAKRMRTNGKNCHPQWKEFHGIPLGYIIYTYISLNIHEYVKDIFRMEFVAVGCVSHHWIGCLQPEP